MRSLTTVILFVVLSSACGSTDPARPANPTTPAIVTTPANPVTPAVIRVGQEVVGKLVAHDTNNVYELTAPADGTLVARLRWDSKDGRLELNLAGSQFGAENGMPIIGRLSVVAGQTYRIIVADGAPWDVDQLNLPFVLTTVIE